MWARIGSWPHWKKYDFVAIVCKEAAWIISPFALVIYIVRGH